MRDRLRPWIGAIRRDLRGRPTVVLPGGLYPLLSLAQLGADLFDNDALLVFLDELLAIAERLRAFGIDVDRARPEDVTSVEGYDAFVIGSAIYMTRWTDEAVDFTRRFSGALRSHHFFEILFRFVSGFRGIII